MTPKKKKPMPSDLGRNARRRQITALPAEWAAIDALAARLSSSGRQGNVSGTIQACVHLVLNLEAEGIVEVVDAYWPRLAVDRSRIRPREH